MQKGSVARNDKPMLTTPACADWLKGPETSQKSHTSGGFTGTHSYSVA